MCVDPWRVDSWPVMPASEATKTRTVEVVDSMYINTALTLGLKILREA
jgi:hypothetical protein